MHLADLGMILKIKKNMEWLKNLGYTCKEDWYKISRKIFEDNGGGGLLSSKYNNSPIKILKALFTDYEWLPWKLAQAPNKSWDDIENQRIYGMVGKKTGYTCMEDWYNISKKIFQDNDGASLFDKYNNGPIKILKALFTDYKWDLSKFRKQYSQGQIEWLGV